MKFDVCLMNPPYGVRGADDLHYRFTEKCILLCNEVICVIPFALISGYGKSNEEYRLKLLKYLVSVEEIEGKIFFDTNQNNVGIYEFNELKDNEDITIKYINGDINISSDLNNKFNLYESKMLDLTVKRYNHVPMKRLSYIRINDEIKKYNKIHKTDISNKQKIEKLKQDIRLQEINKNLNNDIYLSVNYVCGSKTVQPANYITKGITGKILLNNEEVYNYLNKLNGTTGYNFIIFKDKLSAENCRISLLNYFLRFILSKLQNGYNMAIEHCYKYVPDIDWSDPRVTTDEGLLEVCGCPKDKCKEYADYCKEYMEEFDKK